MRTWRFLKKLKRKRERERQIDINRQFGSMLSLGTSHLKKFLLTYIAKMRHFNTFFQE